MKCLLNGFGEIFEGMDFGDQRAGVDAAGDDHFDDAFEDVGEAP